MRSRFLCRALAFVLLGTIARAEIIDRVMAVVGDQIITLSDVRAARRLGLVPADSADDPTGAALERLIDRRLMLLDVDRYLPAEPERAAIDARLAEIQGRFEDALAFETALNQTGMSHDELRRHVRDTLRIDTYLRQRFATMIQPSEDDLLRYYRENTGEFSADGGRPPFEAVREQVRAALVEERRARFVREWLDGLRRRATLVVLYLPAPG